MNLTNPLNPFESKCNKCGKEQNPSKTQNIKYFTRYECGVKCKCGGEFVMWVNGKPLKEYKEVEK